MTESIWYDESNRGPWPCHHFFPIIFIVYDSLIRICGNDICVYIYIYLAIRHWWSHFPQVRIVFTICPCSSAHSSFRWKQKTPWYSDAIIGKCLFTYKNSQIIISNLFQRSTSKFEYPTVWIGILYRRKDCANDRQSGIPLTVDEMIMRRT